MIAACFDFTFLRGSVDGKHLIRFQFLQRIALDAAKGIYKRLCGGDVMLQSSHISTKNTIDTVYFFV